MTQRSPSPIIESPLEWVALRLYSTAMWLAQPLLLLKLWWRGRQQPLYRARLVERFGFYQPSASTLETRIWVHTVSLGETLAISTLIRQLRHQWPGVRFVFTHSTATGMAAGAAMLENGDVQVWAPWDTPGAVARFLRSHEPKLALVMETEVWPGWLYQCEQRGVPVCLINGRLSERSMNKSLRLSWLSRPAFARISDVLAQSAADERRFRKVGAQSVQALGNLKFDVEIAAAPLGTASQWRLRLKKPLVTLASAREGEEALWLQAWLNLRRDSQHMDVNWLVVPRHPERFGAVQALLESAGLDVGLRSDWGESGPSSHDQCDIWLGNSMGEMPLYLGLSDVVLMGGSFAPLGSQNFIEAAACGAAVVVGPSVFNFAEAAQSIKEAGGLVQVQTMTEGVHAARLLALDPRRKESMAAKASGVLQGQKGATHRTLAALAQHRERLGYSPSQA